MDLRFTQDAGRHVFTGSELLVKGALETDGGVHLYTGAPGVPLRGYFDALTDIAPMIGELGGVARIAPSEAATVAMINGAQSSGYRAIAAIRSSGLAAAAEALTHGILAGTVFAGRASASVGGGVIVCGDDPWHDVKAASFDSRFLAEYMHLPLLEPSSPQEIKDWVGAAFALGRAGRIYVGMLLSSSQAEGGGTVTCHANQPAQINQTSQIVNGAQMQLRHRLASGDAQLEQRLTAVIEAAGQLELNRILNRPQKGESVPLGFIASGAAYAFLSQALNQLGLAGRLPILKLGLTYPLDEPLVVDFARQCRRLVIVEERRSFVERQVLQLLEPLRLRGEPVAHVFGKKLPGPGPGIPESCELHPSLLIQLLIPLLKEHPAVLPREMVRVDSMGLNDQLERIEKTATYEVKVSDRQPTFCPGCPHRDSASVLLQLKTDLSSPQYMLNRYKRKPMELVCHEDAGCSSLLGFAPNAILAAGRTGRGLGGMTAGSGNMAQTGHLVFMGDGTFYQSGQSVIAHSIHTGQHVTYVILDNKTTAMTGRHGHASQRHDLMGRPSFAQDITHIVRGMIPKKHQGQAVVTKVDPTDRTRYRNLLEKSVLEEGVTIIVADKECGITFHRREKKKQHQVKADMGYIPKQRFMNIAEEVCDSCHECTRLTGCSGLMLVDSDYGPKVQTDLSACVNDRACQRIGACPSFEMVTVTREQPSTPAGFEVILSDLPSPPRPFHADQDTWRCFLAGVGGMGVGAATAILSAAGREMGYHVQFIRHNGVAVRTGGVYSQLVYTRSESDNHGDSDHTSTTAAIPYGQCDLILGFDLLEAVRAIDPAHRYRVASPDTTGAVVNTAAMPTVDQLLGQADLDPAQLDQTLRRYTKPDQYVGFNVAALSERLLGSKRFINVMLLGVAYQRGLIPLTHEALEKAIRHLFPDEAGRNLQAFIIGRQIVVDPAIFSAKAPPEPTLRSTYIQKVLALQTRYPGSKGRLMARQFRQLVRQMRRAGKSLQADEKLARDAILRAYDCMVWGGIDYVDRYCRQVMRIAQLDDAQHGYQLTRAVVWQLAHVMLIKDEVYVSALLTSPEKYQRDRQRFNINTQLGDQIHYRHYHQPEFVIFGRNIRFEWTSRDWQLRLMSRMRWLRRLMPGWHRRERQYRDWYQSLVEQVDWQPGGSPREYQRWLAILQTPEAVSGYREVWYPRMQAARLRAEQLLATDAQLFEPPAVPTRAKRVSLPIASDL